MSNVNVNLAAELSAMIARIEELKALIETPTASVRQRVEFNPPERVVSLLMSLTHCLELLNAENDPALSDAAYISVRCAITQVIGTCIDGTDFDTFLANDVNWGGGESWYADLIDHVSDVMSGVYSDDDDVNPALAAFIESDDNEDSDDDSDDGSRDSAGVSAVEITHRLSIIDHPRGASITFYRVNGERVETIVSTNGRYSAFEICQAIRSGRLNVGMLPINHPVESTDAIVIYNLRSLLQCLCDRRLLHCSNDGVYTLVDGVVLN